MSTITASAFRTYDISSLPCAFAATNAAAIANAAKVAADLLNNAGNMLALTGDDYMADGIISKAFEVYNRAAHFDALNFPATSQIVNYEGDTMTEEDIERAIEQFAIVNQLCAKIVDAYLDLRAI